MNTCRSPGSLLSKIAVVVAAIIATATVPACEGPTEIVLVIDTNLTKYDIDQVAISITGSMTQTKVLSLAAEPPFPWTLGLESNGGSGAVEVSVAASLQGNPVVQQTADTEFVEGEEKMLRILLLDSCVGIICPSTPPGPLTCIAGVCASTDVSGSSLPSWNGSAPASPNPSATVPIGGRTIWANGWHACANEGTLLYCWGQNSDGEIGDGTLKNANSRKPVTHLAPPAAVGLGQLATCTCDQSGNAWCWGRNVEGELGIGSASANSTTPLQVPGITDCLQITGGANHTCMIHDDGNGTVSCWGSNASGQTGQPTSANGTCSQSSSTTVPCIVSPARVAGLTNASQIVAGENYTCALKSDMTVACWGDNSAGQLGDGTTTSRATVAAVKNLASDIVELSAGRVYVCARHQSGSISCWGVNASGQLGNGNTDNSSSPVSVAGVSDALQLATGLQHTCALRVGSRVSCWGGNSLGQLGNGTTTDSLVPVDVIDLKQVNSIAAGSQFTCARSPTGEAFCWGDDFVNQLGDGAITPQSQPVSVAGFSSM